MARYNEILVGHLNRGLQKFLGMKGEPPSPQLAGEIQPSLSLMSGVENRYLFGWNKYSTFVNVTGGAGQFAGFRLRNPAAANAIAVVEQCVISIGANQQVFIGQETIATDLTTLSGGSRLDARQGSAAGFTSSALKVSSSTNAGVLNITIGSLLLQGTAFQMVQQDDSQIPILPGDAFEVNAGTVATQLVVWTMWRERFLEDGERA